MHRLIVRYGQPAAFDRHHRHAHTGLGQAIPGVAGDDLGPVG